MEKNNSLLLGTAQFPPVTIKKKAGFVSSKVTNCFEMNYSPTDAIRVSGGYQWCGLCKNNLRGSWRKSHLYFLCVRTRCRLQCRHCLLWLKNEIQSRYHRHLHYRVIAIYHTRMQHEWCYTNLKTGENLMQTGDLST